MSARIKQWPTIGMDSLQEVRRCLDSALPDGIARAAIEEAVQRVVEGHESVATVRELLHRYRDDGRIDSADCNRILGMLETQVSEDANTIPGIAPKFGESDDPFTKTTVLPPEEAVDSANSDQRLQVGSVLRDRFMLQERVAGGNMGMVYKALDRRLAEVDGVDPWVAIKVLSPELAGNAQALRALQQEAAKGRCLTHPNIVRFIDFDREDKLFFIVMEWLEGRSLAAVLDSGERQPDLAAALEIVRQTGEALAYAHRCGVIHADVKPGNIMVLPSGSVKLFDFGIARVRQKHADGLRFDPGVLAAATPAYSSMQVLTGEEPVATDDVFSLACLAYRLIAGHRVFGPRNAAEAAESGMEPQRPHHLPDAQWKALRKALSHSRVARHATPGEFVAALLTTRPQTASIAREEPLSVPDDEIVERRFDERRRRWPYLLLPLLAAVLGVTMLRPAWVTTAVSVAEEWLAQQLASQTSTIGDDVLENTAPPLAPPTALPAASAPDVTSNANATIDAAPEALPDAASADTDNTATTNGGVEAASPDPALGADEGTAAVAAGAEDSDEWPNAQAEAAAAAAEGSAGLVLAAPGEDRPELDLTLQEGGDPVLIDVYRWFGLSDPLTVRIDEIGFSGNRSPRDTGQYVLSDNGVISFNRRQRRVTLEISMPADSLREPDQQASLLLRDYYNAGSELGVINLSLLDDDQRAFEANHAVNTIAFATSQISVPERDPAVQIDVLRLNPDRRTLTVRYRVESVTATDGEDFFSPGRQSVTFGPGQRTARLLIPLVQDSAPESDETFYIELDVPVSDSNTFRRIAVIIRDDD